MKIDTGEPIIIVLQNPREKLWGVLREINQSGVFVHGINLNAFEDFVQAVANEQPFYGLNEQFFPMWRVERVSKDDPDGDIPSMKNQFELRTKLKLSDI